MSKKYTDQITLWVTPEMKDTLTKYSFNKAVERSDVIRALLSKWMRDLDAGNDPLKWGYDG